MEKFELAALEVRDPQHVKRVEVRRYQRQCLLVSRDGGLESRSLLRGKRFLQDPRELVFRHGERTVAVLVAAPAAAGARGIARRGGRERNGGSRQSGKGFQDLSTCP